MRHHGESSSPATPGPGADWHTLQRLLPAALLSRLPVELMEALLAHELAHLKEADHDKAFYGLCTWMEPDYHQIEFDLRLYLAHRELHGPVAWG